MNIQTVRSIASSNAAPVTRMEVSRRNYAMAINFASGGGNVTEVTFSTYIKYCGVLVEMSALRSIPVLAVFNEVANIKQSIGASNAMCGKNYDNDMIIIK